MNREQYIAILEVDIAELRNKERQLIKYLENQIKHYDENIEKIKEWLDIEEIHLSVKNDLHCAKVVKRIYENVLEKVRSGKYD